MRSHYTNMKGHRYVLLTRTAEGGKWILSTYNLSHDGIPLEVYRSRKRWSLFVNQTRGAWKHEKKCDLDGLFYRVFPVDSDEAQAAIRHDLSQSIPIA